MVLSSPLATSNYLNDPGQITLRQVRAGRQTQPTLEQLFRHVAAYHLAATEDRRHTHKSSPDRALLAMFSASRASRISSRVAPKWVGFTMMTMSQRVWGRMNWSDYA